MTAWARLLLAIVVGAAALTALGARADSTAEGVPDDSLAHIARTYDAFLGASPDTNRVEREYCRHGFFNDVRVGRAVIDPEFSIATTVLQVRLPRFTLTGARRRRLHESSLRCVELLLATAEALALSVDLVTGSIDRTTAAMQALTLNLPRVGALLLVPLASTGRLPGAVCAIVDSPAFSTYAVNAGRSSLLWLNHIEAALGPTLMADAVVQRVINSGNAPVVAHVVRWAALSSAQKLAYRTRLRGWTLLAGLNRSTRSCVPLIDALAALLVPGAPTVAILEPPHAFQLVTWSKYHSDPSAVLAAVLRYAAAFAAVEAAAQSQSADAIESTQWNASVLFACMHLGARDAPDARRCISAESRQLGIVADPALVASVDRYCHS